MDYSPLVESWLQEATLPGTLSRNLSADGEWSATIDGRDVSLYVENDEGRLYASAALFTLGDGVTVDFFRELLSLQAEGALPPGFAFALDDEDDTLYLSGVFPLRFFDSAGFNTVLTMLLSATAAWPERLRAILRDTVDGAAVRLQEKPDATDETLSGLTDEEYLRAQMMQSIRI